MKNLIVGSGWPFGGRFLSEDEIMQRLGVKKQSVKANSSININLNEFLSFKSHYAPETVIEKPTSDVKLVSAKLILVNEKSLDEIIDITSEVNNNRLVYHADNNDYMLVAVYNERNLKNWADYNTRLSSEKTKCNE